MLDDRVLDETAALNFAKDAKNLQDLMLAGIPDDTPLAMAGTAALMLAAQAFVEGGHDFAAFLEIATAVWDLESPEEPEEHV